MNLCSQLIATYNNTSISNGNNFDATWEDFCSIGLAACGPCQEQDYFALRAITGRIMMVGLTPYNL